MNTNEALRILYRVIDFIFEVIGIFLAFVVELANRGLAFYSSGDRLGKVLALFVFVLAVWLLVWTLHAVGRYATVALVALLAGLLVVSLIDPSTNYALRR